MKQSSTAPKFLPGAFVGLCCLEAALLLGVVLHFKLTGRPAGTPLGSLDYAVMAAALLALLAALLLIRGAWRRPGDRRGLALTAGLNAVLLIVTFGLLEIGLRSLVALRPEVTSMLPRGLLPRDWPALAAANKALIEDFSEYGSYLTGDARLGWTVGPSRSSRDGLYFSSAEGIRSAAPGIAFADARGVRRIALLGDSYAFAEAVPWEDSWGRHLGDRLGPDFQVLNFGVPGYGVDQAYLRYEYDAAGFAPEVAILAFIAHDLHRTMAVYTAIAFPTWELPYAKPRFVLDQGTLELVNSPVPDIDALVAERDVSRLPHIDLEPAFLASDWRAHWYQRPYSLRFALSMIPNWPAGDERRLGSVVDINAAILRRFSDTARARGTRPVVVYLPSTAGEELDGPAGPDAMPPLVRAVLQSAGDERRLGSVVDINAAILRRFSDTARARGTRPVVVYLPSTAGEELDGPAGPDAMPPLVRAVLQSAGTGYFNASDCVRAVDPQQRVAPDGIHYSAAVNAALAACVHDWLAQEGVIPAGTAARPGS